MKDSCIELERLIKQVDSISELMLFAKTMDRVLPERYFELKDELEHEDIGIGDGV